MSLINFNKSPLKYSSLISAASFSARHLRHPDAWVGHLPFAHWLIKQINPKIFVELGTHSGNSYFSFCQTVKDEKLQTRCYAVDTWKGDEHAGFYSEEIYSSVNQYNQNNFNKFSKLLPMTFDEAVDYFSDNTIDLIHIDGLHTYEAVKHDFETWLPKLSSGAVVLFHDTNVRQHEFGVWKLWEELQINYALNIEFVHSHGLGVIQLEDGPEDNQLPWLTAENSEKEELKHYFASLGAMQNDRFQLLMLQGTVIENKKSINQLHSLTAELNRNIENRDQINSELHKSIGEYHQYVQNLQNTISLHEEEIEKLNENLMFLRERVSSSQIKANNYQRQISKLTSYSNVLQEQINNLNNALLESEKQRAKDHVLAYTQQLEIFNLFHNTRTWKLTRPFRSATNIARQVRNKLKGAQNNKQEKLPETNDDTEAHKVDLSLISRGFNDQDLMKYLIDSELNTPFFEEKIIPYTVTIIIPVYKGIFETQRCLQSVLNSNNETKFNLLIINDCSPEAEMSEMLLSFISSNVEILENEQNLGFVKTVNRGMNYAGDSDVILLNSDTIVSNNWLDRLINQAYSNENIGTVTPFSNNATICNYPTLDGWSKLPDSEDLSKIDSAFSIANFSKNIEIPTAVGFCMYIKRDCLNEVGLFDEQAFGKGYGEENDFCLRASRKGWRHILAADIFVFHEGEVSFSSNALEGKANALKVIHSRYPDYENQITNHILKNEAYQYRIAATAARYRSGTKPVILMVSHNLGGGTEKHIEEISDFIEINGGRVLILRPHSEGKVSLKSYIEDDRLQVTFDSSDLEFLGKTLKSFGVKKAHVHHTLGFSFSIDELLALMQIPYDFTVHDYFSICPRIFLMKPDVGFCNVPHPSECNTCLSLAPNLAGNSDIYWWRLRYASLLNGAERVICPSEDTAKRIGKVYPSAPIVVVPHEEMSLVTGEAYKPKIRFALLGVLGIHKGLEFVEKLIQEVSYNNLPIEFILIGKSERPIEKSDIFFETGEYVEEEIQHLINGHDPDAILFLSQCPETYSYTLSAALENNRPIVAPNFGSFPERLKTSSKAHIFPFEYSAPELIDFLKKIFFSKLSNKSTISKIKSTLNSFYRSEKYWESNPDKLLIPTLLLIPEMSGHIPSPCSYIRLIKPLMSSTIQKVFRLRVSSQKVISHIRPEIVITNRLGCRDTTELKLFLQQINLSNSKLFYDIDDNLLQLHDNHPENEYYKNKKEIILSLLKESDCVWTSTERLAKELSPYCRKILTIENYLDEKLLETKSHYVIPNEKFKILYMGTTSHQNDLKEVLPALEKLAINGIDFELNLIGIKDDESLEEWIKVIHAPTEASYYPHFMRWLKTLNRFDLGIAPLELSDFNDCKSDIKFWDYTAMGIPTLASNVGAYKRIIKDGENGLLADNSADSWFEKLNWAINNRDKTTKLVDNAANYLRKLARKRSIETERQVSLLHHTPYQFIKEQRANI